MIPLVGLAVAAALWAALVTWPSLVMGGALAAWYVVLSGAAAIAWTRDKSAARRRTRRTPERTLLALALVGGFPGAWLASRVVRHKTRKQSFLWAFRGRVLGHALVVVAAVGAALSL